MAIKDVKDTQVINGTYGEIWVNNTYLATLKKFSAKVKLNYGDVVRPRDLWKGKKLIELEGEGELTVDKYDSLGINLMHDALSRGTTPDIKIMSKLDDPGAIGAERIVIKNVTFNELTLADFEHAKTLEESLSFSFRHYELYDAIGE